MAYFNELISQFTLPTLSKLGIQKVDTIVTWHHWHPHHSFGFQRHPTQLATSATWPPPQLGGVLRQDELIDR